MIRKQFPSLPTIPGELSTGMQLSEPGLAKQFGMSRTPVREALRQLENEGLLDYAPRFGAMVRVPDRDELSEMYSFRAWDQQHEDSGNRS